MKTEKKLKKERMKTEKMQYFLYHEILYENLKMHLHVITWINHKMTMLNEKEEATKRYIQCDTSILRQQSILRKCNHKHTLKYAKNVIYYLQIHAYVVNV